MLVGYLRVSSADERQSVDLQRDALLAAGVDERHFHLDKASGARDDRPGLRACLAYLAAGDVLVVWKGLASAAPAGRGGGRADGSGWPGAASPRSAGSGRRRSR